ncbi:hypothetical protein [Craterilacuibacter sp. RT1T]|uniref:hypothetical protein n=1 Tax=Craterilacuibacter sp. RT1T TaxID=2942211 RepID=UPI0020BD835A|nr:hypothetical protein [Craterilacuibacter sp. RT1T]MCL6264384.1 hypothetical protein [Craterilacuibacter sp. RT1T]
MINKLSRRFHELEQQLEAIGATQHVTNSEIFGSTKKVDFDSLSEWQIKTKNLLVKSCGADSEHYKAFIRAEVPRTVDSSLSIYKRVRAVFRAAKEDFDGGYLSSMKSLVQAEVFNSELEQATELLSKGYKLAAAVIAGVVLETGIREICDRHNIAHAKLDKMNSDLAQKGVYSKLQQKRITALADIRNSAAHGKPEEFSDDDVLVMIRDVESFLSNHIEE